VVCLRVQSDSDLYTYCLSSTDFSRIQTAVVSLAIGDSGTSLIQKDVDGVDLSAVFEDVTVSIRNYSFSQYSRCPGDRLWPKKYNDSNAKYDWFMNNCEGVPAKNISYMGYTVRSPDYRYTMWFHWDGATCEAMWDAPLEVSDPLNTCSASIRNRDTRNSSFVTPHTITICSCHLLFAHMGCCWCFSHRMVATNCTPTWATPTPAISTLTRTKIWRMTRSMPT
jgi:hypothetical protein